ncbi:MAG: MaoC/PaaZ C-terminal domain-containing protein [Halobacteria archaeon]|nr:MaoC/PaaZ C-terminal domain-containing protein [Halobacteria archaeon]
MPTFEELEEGRTFETTARTITEADIVNFAGVSGDFNYLHTDEETMSETEYGARIAHGALVFSVLTGLMWQSRHERPEVVAFYGVDNLRFTAPVFVGDTIHGEAELVEKQERDHPEASGTVRNHVEVINQDGETVLACDMTALVK